MEAWGIWLKGSLWAYPALETVHIVAIATLFGSLLVFEVRLFGLARSLPLPTLAALALPVSVAGFALAAVSGLLLFAAAAPDLLVNPAFRLKLLLLVAAGTNVAIFHARLGVQRDDGLARVQAGVSLLLWLGVIACGRAIAYV